MKSFRIIFVAFITIIASHLQMLKKQDVIKNDSNIVATYPASVTSISKKQASDFSDKSVSASHQKQGLTGDNVTSNPASPDLSHTVSKKRKVITLVDTPSQKFKTRPLPGIEWIIQKLDKRTILKVGFENDLITFANTDRYYTNGIQLDLQAAWLAASPFQKLMIPYRNAATVTYRISLFQQMYTPTDTRVAPLLNHDRPYASVLYFGFRKTVTDPLREIKLSSEINAGYIGPYSLGSSLQTFVHKTFPTNDKPLGWETQLKSDLVLNYNAQIQKAWINRENVSLLAGLKAEAGTLYTNAGAGLQLQAGKADPVFGLGEHQHWPLSECYFFAGTNINFVAYNALIQGGLFNHRNVFTLKNNEIQHVVGNAEAGFHFRHKGIGMEIAQHLVSPEYKGGLWHKWGRVSLLLKW